MTHKLTRRGLLRAGLAVLLGGPALAARPDRFLPFPVQHRPLGPAAISIPFAALPMNLYIRGPRYKVGVSQEVTPRVT